MPLPDHRCRRNPYQVCPYAGKWRADSGRPCADPTQVFGPVFESIFSIIDQYQEKIEGVAFSVPGKVDSQTGPFILVVPWPI